jgi:hypothetical protein
LIGDTTVLQPDLLIVCREITKKFLDFPPAGFIKKDFIHKRLKKKYGSIMTAFPEITKDEVATIVQYINESNGNRLPIP